MKGSWRLLSHEVQMFPDPLNCLLWGLFFRNTTLELLIVYDCRRLTRWVLLMLRNQADRCMWSTPTWTLEQSMSFSRSSSRTTSWYTYRRTCSSRWRRCDDTQCGQMLVQQSRQQMFFSFFLAFSWRQQPTKNFWASSASNHAGFRIACLRRRGTSEPCRIYGIQTKAKGPRSLPWSHRHEGWCRSGSATNMNCRTRTEVINGRSGDGREYIYYISIKSEGIGVMRRKRKRWTWVLFLVFPIHLLPVL